MREQRVALAGLARREGLGAEEALDCVHDAFCTFLQMAQRGEPRQLPADAAEHAPLLAGIVVNTARNRRRRHHLAKPHRDIDAVERGDDSPSVEREG